MTDEEVLKCFLSKNQPFKKEGEDVYSMIICLLRSARHLSGVDLETGEFNISNTFDSMEKGLYFSFQFSGMLNYLMLLEQIGNLIEPKIIDKKTDEKGIKRALFFFAPKVNKDDRIAIYQLRNSLAHNFALATENNKHPHKFVISIESSSEIISRNKSGIKWDGDFAKKSEDVSTTVYLLNLIQLVEGIFSKVKIMAEEGKLNFNRKIGKDELFARYAIR